MAVGNNINDIYKTTINGKEYTINPASQGGHMKAYEQYAANSAAAKDKYEAGLKSDLAANNAQTNANYDNAARQAYVDYMRKQRSLPSQLQALGVNGGATESGLLNLYNNYGNAHAANEQQRNAEIATNQRDFDTAWRQYVQDYDNDLKNQWQTAYNNQMNEYNNEITRFSSSVAQYPTTEGGYKSYQNWIANMEKSNDPLKDIKVALIRQQMATQFPDGAPKEAKKSGGGGGSRRSYGGRSSGGSSSSGGGNWNSAVKNASDAVRRVASGYTRTGSGSFARGIAKGSTNKIARSATGYRWTR